MVNVKRIIAIISILFCVIGCSPDNKTPERKTPTKHIPPPPSEWRAIYGDKYEQRITSRRY